MRVCVCVCFSFSFNYFDYSEFSGDLCHGDPEEWFFFIRRQESEARGGRPKRLTSSGYWKATGSPSPVYSSNSNRSIGEKRTMVFYEGRAPRGRKTEWKMNEFKAMEEEAEASYSNGGHPRVQTIYYILYITINLGLFNIYVKGRLMTYKTNTESSPPGHRFVIDKLHLKEYNHVNLYY